MKKILLALLLLFSGNLVGKTNLGPKEFMKHFVKIFNEENLSEYKKSFHFPNSIIANGQITYNHEDKIPLVFFENFKKAGWVYTQINRLKVLFEDKNTAVIMMEYSRFDKNDTVYLRTKGVYTLSKEKGFWQVISMATMSPEASK
jgi:hypothetical protein